jgi:hypothetical protein
MSRDKLAALTFAVVVFLLAAIVVFVLSAFVETKLGLVKPNADPLATSAHPKGGSPVGAPPKDQSHVEPQGFTYDAPVEPFDFGEPQVDCRIYSFHGNCYVL